MSAILSSQKGLSNSCINKNSELSKLVEGIQTCDHNLPSVYWSCVITLSNRWTIVIWSSLLGKLSKASRVSEIQGLSIGKTHSLFERNGIKPLPKIQFSSKTQRLGKLWKPILIPLVQIEQTWFCSLREFHIKMDCFVNEICVWTI